MHVSGTTLHGWTESMKKGILIIKPVRLSVEYYGKFVAHMLTTSQTRS